MPVLPQASGGARVGQIADSYIQGRNAGETWMGMQQRREMGEQQIEQNRRALAFEEVMRPLRQAQVEADIEKAKVEYASNLGMQETRKGAYALYAKANQDFDYLNQITDDKARAAASREWLSRYSQLANVKELEGEMKTKAGLATSNIMDVMKLNMLTGAEARSFETLIKDFSPDEQVMARKVKAGLEGRASSAGKKSQTVKMPDGSSAELVFDPQTGEYSIPTIKGAAGPVATPKDGNTMVSQSTFDEARDKEAGQKSAERTAELAKLKPKRAAGVRAAEAAAQDFTADIDDLIANVSAATAGPGGVLASKFPGTTARDFAANIESLKARIGVQMLQAMREASPTGGALGNITQQENVLMQSLLGALDVGQSPKQLLENLKKVKARASRTLGLIQTGYHEEFGEEAEDAKEPLKVLSIKRIE